MRLLNAMIVTFVFGVAFIVFFVLRVAAWNVDVAFWSSGIIILVCCLMIYASLAVIEKKPEQ